MDVSDRSTQETKSSNYRGAVVENHGDEIVTSLQENLVPMLLGNCSCITLLHTIHGVMRGNLLHTHTRWQIILWNIFVKRKYR